MRFRPIFCTSKESRPKTLIIRFFARIMLSWRVRSVSTCVSRAASRACCSLSTVSRALIAALYCSLSSSTDKSGGLFCQMRHIAQGYQCVIIITELSGGNTSFSSATHKRPHLYEVVLNKRGCLSL